MAAERIEAFQDPERVQFNREIEEVVGLHHAQVFRFEPDAPALPWALRFVPMYSRIPLCR